MKKNGGKSSVTAMTSFEPSALAAAINAMTDAQVDALLPPGVRIASSVYWTPVRVARRAAQIFDALGVRRVLDVGAGPGKFCVVAGARMPRMAFVGVEHRPHLVAAAQSLAAAVGSTNVTFLLSDATCLPYAGFDGFYVFNPFAENSFSRHEQLDQTVELSHVRRIDDVMRVERWLATRPPGNVLVTYHGLGGPIPGCYERVHVEAAGSAWLRAWRKGSDGASNRYWLEDGEDAILATFEEVVRHLLPDPEEGP